jgi:polyhydroxybutyrate depolymerase
MRSMLVSFALVACAHSSAAPITRLAPGDHEIEIRHDGLARHYLVHVPPQAARGAPLPVIVNYHGGGGDAPHHREWVHMEPLADREGIVLVFPDGTGRRADQRRLLTFDAGQCCGPAKDNHVDDVGFTLAALADLAARTSIDRTRIYATGMSNGSMMAYRLASEAPGRIAAIAPVAGANDLGNAPLAAPVPVIHIHSVDDPRALYAGGLGPPFPFTDVRVEHRPVETVVRAWAAADGCASEPTVAETRHGQPGAPDATFTATKLVWSACHGDAEVVLWKLTGSGHVWPGAKSLLPKLLGPPTTVIDANEEMWAFFRRFRRPDAPPL